MSGLLLDSTLRWFPSTACTHFSQGQNIVVTVWNVPRHNAMPLFWTINHLLIKLLKERLWWKERENGKRYRKTIYFGSETKIWQILYFKYKKKLDFQFSELEFQSTWAKKIMVRIFVICDIYCKLKRTIIAHCPTHLELCYSLCNCFTN